jgi:hypothetical protein
MMLQEVMEVMEVVAEVVAKQKPHCLRAAPSSH